MAREPKKEKPPPEVFNFVTVSGSGETVRYWAALLRNFEIERRAGPFMHIEHAEAAFLPVPVWPRPQPVTDGARDRRETPMFSSNEALHDEDR